MAAVQETVDRVRQIDVDQYRYGFETLIESEKAPKGLSEDTVRFISAKKNEPAWMLEWRLEAYRRWLTMTEPSWARVNYPKIDYQDLYYYSAPKPKKQLSSIDEIDPEILKTYEKLGIPLREVAMLEGVQPPPGGEPSPNRKIAVDAVFDSVSVATTFQKELKQAGVIFMPISEAIREHPELVKKYLGTVVPTSDNFFATLNSAVFSDGSFVYVPPGVRCPMELSTYFRINERNSCMPPWSNWSRWTMPRSNIRRCRTGIPATPKARAASTTSSPSAVTAAASIRRFHGPRSRPDRRSPGNIRAASCAAITRAASFIRSRFRTVTSRSIPAPR
jgi:Fe-S cluster assembly protein SufB